MNDLEAYSQLCLSISNTERENAEGLIQLRRGYEAVMAPAIFDQCFRDVQTRMAECEQELDQRRQQRDAMRARGALNGSFIVPLLGKLLELMETNVWHEAKLHDRKENIGHMILQVTTGKYKYLDVGNGDMDQMFITQSGGYADYVKELNAYDSIIKHCQKCHLMDNLPSSFEEMCCFLKDSTIASCSELLPTHQGRDAMIYVLRHGYLDVGDRLPHFADKLIFKTTDGPHHDSCYVAILLGAEEWLRYYADTVHSRAVLCRIIDTCCLVPQGIW